MSSATLRLVLLVSCAHAMVHIYELAFPSVEELVAESYQVEKPITGALSNTWRFPWGLGALLAGWLVDRYGAKWLLVVYLIGCAAASAFIATQPDLPLLFVSMFTMGAFASIYHPAGLALISHETAPEHRPMALGYHGIIGSMGIASAPLLGGLVLSGFAWTGYYAALVLPGLLLAGVLAVWLKEHHRRVEPAGERGASAPRYPGGAKPPDARSQHRGANAPRSPEGDGNWRAFSILIVSGLLSGFVYAALISFLPRYLGGLDLRPDWMPDRSFKNYVTGVVLVVGIAGQYAAGRFGRHGALERQLPMILFALVPALLGMAFAGGNWRVLAACGASFVIFMQQPIYNSLIAQYVPARRRSFGYGISNALAFGIGSFGASFSGVFYDDVINFSCLAGVAVMSGGVAVLLARGTGERGPSGPR